MTPYEYGFLTKCAEYGVDANWLLKEAVQAKIFPEQLSEFEQFLHEPDALLRGGSPIKAYSRDAIHNHVYGDGTPWKDLFDSHGNFKLNGKAEKVFNLSHTLPEGGNISLTQALRTPGSHHSARALKFRLPKRLERQLYRGEIRDAIWNFERGNKAFRMKKVLTDRAARALANLAKSL